MAWLTYAPSRVVAASALVVGLAGCGFADAGSGTTQRPLGPAAAQATHERPSPPAPAETATGAAASQVAAIRGFTATYINWTADDVAQQMRALATRSVGQARSAMQLAAAQSAGDYELQQGGIANSGTVEAIAPLAGGRDRFVVVTRETTSASNSTAYQGLRPAWHVAEVGVVELSRGRWVVSRWQPEN